MPGLPPWESEVFSPEQRPKDVTWEELVDGVEDAVLCFMQP